MTDLVKRTEESVAASAVVEQYTADLANVLTTSGIDVRAFRSYVQGQLDTNPKLALAAAANGLSLMQACMKAAYLGHVPDGIAGALVPYGINENYQTGELSLGKDPKVEFIEMYQGLKARLENANPGLLICFDVVRQWDMYTPAPALGEFPTFVKGGGLERHHPFLSLEVRGKVVGAFAYARLPNGLCSPVVEMGSEEIDRYRPKDRQGNNRKSTFWDGEWGDKMQAKTALLRLEKYLPTSSASRQESGARLTEIAKVAAVRGVALPALTENPEYDGELEAPVSSPPAAS
jgi:recombination protein RecT